MSSIPDLEKLHADLASRLFQDLVDRKLDELDARADANGKFDPLSLASIEDSYPTNPSGEPIHVTGSVLNRHRRSLYGLSFETEATHAVEISGVFLNALRRYQSEVPFYQQQGAPQLDEILQSLLGSTSGPASNCTYNQETVAGMLLSGLMSNIFDESDHRNWPVKNRIARLRTALGKVDFDPVPHLERYFQPLKKPMDVEPALIDQGVLSLHHHLRLASEAWARCS